tara:strand:+ start:153 stop:563 length:411 start_codon:yes stop_codon:yes gene_type:complete
MHVVTTSTDLQTIRVIPRRQNSGVVSVIVYDKSSRRTIDYNSLYYWNTANINYNENNNRWEDESNAVFTYGDPFSTVSGQFSFRENEYYGIKLIDSSGELYKGVLFCTDQTDYDKFDVHKDDYVVEQSYNNEYITV